MQAINKTSKVLMILLALGLIIWLGGNILRTVIAYDLYVPATELTLKSNYSDEIRMHTVRLYAMGALYTDIAYGVAFLSALALFVRFRRELRQRGWLFMSYVLFILAAPVDLYSIFLDIKLNLAVMYNSGLTFFSDEVQRYFASRFRTMNLFSPLAYLAVITSIIIVIWRPLDKVETKKEAVADEVK
jgi:hypothetical protein